MTSQICFNWDIHCACNYRCPYCWFDGKWEQLAGQNKYPPLTELLEAWANVRRRYGSVYIELVGGEPFVYPHFAQLVKELSNIHTIGKITTNLSVDLDEFLKEVQPSKAKLCPTFHPLFADFDPFVRKVLQLKERGMTGPVNYLAYPPQIKSFEHYRQEFDKHGIQLIVMTFWGQYNGIIYPQGYTEQEKAVIERHLYAREGEKSQFQPKKVKGRLCRAGQIYANIKADGTVFRCGGNVPQQIGNLFRNDFRLLDKPMPCESEFCPCNEWASLLVHE